MAGRHRVRRVNGRWTDLGPTPKPWYRRVLDALVGLGNFTNSFATTSIALVAAALILGGL